MMLKLIWISTRSISCIKCLVEAYTFVLIWSVFAHVFSFLTFQCLCVPIRMLKMKSMMYTIDISTIPFFFLWYGVHISSKSCYASYLWLSFICVFEVLNCSYRFWELWRTWAALSVRIVVNLHTYLVKEGLMGQPPKWD